MTTAAPVLLEMARALARPAWRASALARSEPLRRRPDVPIALPEPTPWERGWGLHRDRPDAAGSLTDGVSFPVRQRAGLTDALTAGERCRRAGFRAGPLADPAAG